MTWHKGNIQRALMSRTKHGRRARCRARLDQIRSRERLAPSQQIYARPDRDQT